MASSTIANVNGQQTWEVSSASVSSFSTTTNATVNKPEVSFSVNFTNTQPIDLLVTDLAFGAGNDAELKALFDPLIINNSGINWNGFRIDLVDVDSSTGGGLHPMWAHFHDSTLAGWLNPSTGVFPYNPKEGYDRTTKLSHTPPAGFSSLTGASELQLSGGTFAAGTLENWSDIGIHEWDASMSTANTFEIELTPIVDDFPADATTTAGVSIGGSTRGNLENTGDHDWFRVQLTAGVQYRLDLQGETGGSGTLHDPLMELFNGSGQLITSNDDSNGTLNSEIVYTPTTSGTYYIDAGAFSNASTGSYRVSVSVAHNSTADFNGDNFSDILWQDTDGTPAIWLMDGTNPIGGGVVNHSNPGPSWHAVGAGDFNGDGKADILWQNTDGTPAIWLMDGTNPIGGGVVNHSNPGPSWRAVGPGDFNGDGKADILWQNTDGTPAIWLMDGTNPIGGGVVNHPNPGPSWRAVGAGDFNGDGKADILWQNTDGTPAIWLMDGTNPIGGGVVNHSNPGPSWRAVGAGDFNRDGMSDIQWQNTDGTPAIWLMNGTNPIGGGVVNHSNPGADWRIV
jgi:FG-GAP-like repeat/Bacterial pre-peptidase C-terminal domain